MKKQKLIHTKTIIDIETGSVLHDEVELWTGPVALAKTPKAPKVQTIQAPPPTEEEIQQRQLANTLSRLQLGEMGYEIDPNFDAKKLQGDIAYREALLRGENPDYQASAESDAAVQKEIDAMKAQLSAGGLKKRALTPAEQEQADLEDMIMKRFKEDLNRKPGEVSPEQEKALNELYGSEQSKMDEELARFAVEQSGARGLSLNDTPLAREVLLAKGRGQTELGAARASSKLNFEERNRLFNQGLTQWRSDLQQQRMANLMGAQGQAANAAIGFMNARANLKPSMFQGTGGSGQSPIPGMIGGIGTAIGGIAAAF